MLSEALFSPQRRRFCRGQPPDTARDGHTYDHVGNTVPRRGEAHLSELIARVRSQHDRVTVTVHGRPTAVLLALEDLEALEETVAVLADKDTLRQLSASDAELGRDEGESEESLAEAMRRRRDPE